MVVFMAHGLTPDSPSTRQITPVLQRHGSRWTTAEEILSGSPLPRPVEWFRCPLVFEGQRAELRFRIVPVHGLPLLRALRGGADDALYRWFRDDALASLAAARADGASVQLGWGAYAKLVTAHGARFLRGLSGTRIRREFSSSHGDAGTIHFILEAMRRVAVPRRSTIAVMGALGVIGRGLVRAAREFEPRKLVLVVKPGTDLRRVHPLVEEARRFAGRRCEVVVHEQMTRAALEHDARVVLIATNGKQRLVPRDIPRGSLVFDTTTPSAIGDGPWSERGSIAVRAGCARLPASLLPDGLGRDGDGERVWDRGAGGPNVVWGCAAECIGNALAQWRGHIEGPRVEPEVVARSAAMFARLGVEPQAPLDPGGKVVPWEELRDFVQRHHRVSQE
ncbi:MAG: hypothetical protein ACQEXJ_05375 [Myxococcota bacterium]